VISITLPSLYPDALMRTLQNIQATTKQAHEIIVVSPFDPMVANSVVWIKEAQPIGCNAAHMAAMGMVGGEFVTGWVDDHVYLDDWSDIVVEDFLEREALFHAKCPGMPFVLGLRHIDPAHVGTEFGIYYPYFPFMRTSTARSFGWFTDEYRVGFADSDLAMRIWSAGGRCEWTCQGLIMHLPDDGQKHKDAASWPGLDGAHCVPGDMSLFLAKWASKYGVGWDISHLRGFNIDVTPERFPQFMDETKRTIYYNRPDFKAVVGNGG
jgi:hypothetical protein